MATAEREAATGRVFAELRIALGYADYLGALQKFRLGIDNDPHLLLMSGFLLEYPFHERLFPRALVAVPICHAAQARR